jgi:glutamate-5-semialdehyde dehydrogenase
MQLTKSELEEKCRVAKTASKKLGLLDTKIKNKALLNISRALRTKQKEILAANELDYKEAEASGMSTAMLDRLMLSQNRLESIAQDVKTVAALPDPIGEIIEQRNLPNGLKLSKKRVPLGVIGSIYESRPNVTIDISVLCLKAGNAVILRGGKEALHSNKVLASIIQQAASEAGVPLGAVQFIESTDKSLVDHMLRLRETIDLIIPRGSASLIKFVAENASMPVVAGGIGVCHTFVDKDADLRKAVAIANNAKVQRPTVCNALDSLLIHAEIAERFLPMIAKEWNKAGVEMHCDDRSFTILESTPSLKLVQALDEDWGKEFLALIAAVKVVDSLDEALQHIDQYGSGHSEAIITRDKKSAARFLNEVDAACVYANASTRFTDGSQFGLGAEIGISTQKIHARGPMALRELTSYKWLITGDGHVRP